MSLLLLLLCLVDHPAFAVNANANGRSDAPQTLTETASALGSGKSSERRFAARVLRQQVNSALKQSGRGGGTSLLSADALLFLEDADRTLAPRCVTALQHADVRVACAQIIAALEYHAGRPALAQAIAQEDHPMRARRLARALRRLDTTAPGITP